MKLVKGIKEEVKEIEEVKAEVKAEEPQITRTQYVKWLKEKNEVLRLEAENVELRFKVQYYNMELSKSTPVVTSQEQTKEESK